jgi:hypothetical protein
MNFCIFAPENGRSTFPGVLSYLSTTLSQATTAQPTRSASAPPQSIRSPKGDPAADDADIETGRLPPREWRKNQ